MVRPGKRLSRNGGVECGSLREMKAGGGCKRGWARNGGEGRGGEETFRVFHIMRTSKDAFWEGSGFTEAG